MDLRPRESVILADDYNAMVAWFRDVLGFEVTDVFSDEFNYTNLVNAAGVRIGVAPAAEMGVKPGERSRNTVLLQFEVDDVKALLEHVAASGGVASFGPSFDKAGGFWFGGFSDPEGNPYWVVDSNCP